MAKERSINPAAAQRKADKQKEINKSRKQQQSQKNEKLAKRNPDRLQRQVDELKELEAAGTLRPKDKENLAQLERDLKGVKRAREALGVKDDSKRFSERKDVRQEQRERRQQQQPARQPQHLGKRRRDDDNDDNGSDTDPEVRSIPMPRDTPPPIPRQPNRDSQIGADGQRRPHALPFKPNIPPPQLTYGAAPQIRDLKKEAVKFMPSVVSQQKNRMKGQGRLLEPEEADRLEKSGYADAKKMEEEVEKEVQLEEAAEEIRMQGANVDQLEEEARRFEREMAELGTVEAEASTAGARGVMMEEVEDDGTQFCVSPASITIEIKMTSIAYLEDSSYYEDYYEDDSGIDLNDSNSNHKITDWMDNQDLIRDLRAQLLLQHAQDQAQLTPAWLAAQAVHQLLLSLLWMLFSPLRWTLHLIDVRLSSSNGKAYILSIHEHGNLPHRTPYHRIVGVFTNVNAAKAAVAEMLALPEYKGRLFLGLHTPESESEMGSMILCFEGQEGLGRHGHGGGDGGFRFIVERMCVKWR
ncbi:hypothetical protein LTR86_003403 [Recurvomyces mirabilis]|nr:hypothetical protein LTR86_003403 [Recurvomyces mirabilis]